MKKSKEFTTEEKEESTEGLNNRNVFKQGENQINEYYNKTCQITETDMPSSHLKGE